MPSQSFTKQSNKQRFMGNLKLDSTYDSALIGRGGMGIRSISETIGRAAGVFVKLVSPGQWEVSAYSEEAVKRAGMLLKEKAKKLKNGAQSTGPKGTFKSDPGAVRHLIGAGGAGIKSIMRRVGDVFIVHNRELDEFQISGNSQGAVDQAISILDQQNKDWLKAQIPKVVEMEPKKVSANRFAVLEPEEEETKPKVGGKRGRGGRQSWTKMEFIPQGGRLAALKAERAAKYALRKTLATLKSVEEDAVSWDDVDAEFERMKNADSSQSHEPATIELRESDFPNPNSKAENVRLLVEEKERVVAGPWGKSAGLDAVKSGSGTYAVGVSKMTHRPKTPPVPVFHRPQMVDLGDSDSEYDYEY